MASVADYAAAFGNPQSNALATALSGGGGGSSALDQYSKIIGIQSAKQGMEAKQMEMAKAAREGTFRAIYNLGSQAQTPEQWDALVDRVATIPGFEEAAQYKGQFAMKDQILGSVVAVLNDPTAEFGLSPQGGQLVRQRPDTMSPEAEAQKARIAQAGRSTTNITLQGTPGEDARDRATGQQIAEFVDAGGYADSEKNIQQLDGVIAELKSGKNLTGPVLGNVPQSVRAMTNPESVDAEERVQEVVQRNLRVVLGAQFTANEGQQLISRAYNPRLPEATNAARLSRLRASMKKAYDAKVAASEYFNQHRTMRGYNGPRLWTLSDIEADAGLSIADKNKPAQNKPKQSGRFKIESVE